MSSSYKCPKIEIKHKPNTYKCAWCDIIFTGKRNSKNKHTFCSRKHYELFNRGERNYRWNMGQKKCLNCGQVFNPLRIGKKKFGGRGKIFCGKSCREKYRWKKGFWKNENGRRYLAEVN